MRTNARKGTVTFRGHTALTTCHHMRGNGSSRVFANLRSQTVFPRFLSWTSVVCDNPLHSQRMRARDPLAEDRFLETSQFRHSGVKLSRHDPQQTPIICKRSICVKSRNRVSLPLRAFFAKQSPHPSLALPLPRSQIPRPLAGGGMGWGLIALTVLFLFHHRHRGAASDLRVHRRRYARHEQSAL